MSMEERDLLQPGDEWSQKTFGVASVIVKWAATVFRHLKCGKAAWLFRDLLRSCFFELGEDWLAHFFHQPCGSFMAK